MLRRSIWLAACVMLGAGPAACEAKENKLSDDAKAILEQADQFELYSLDPEQTKEKPKDTFHGWKVLGKTTVKEKADRGKLMESLQKGIKDNDGTVAACFNPRHGLKATKGDKTVELVICFECYQVEVWLGENRDSVLVTRSPQPAFDKVLKDAKVPLPKKGE